MNDNYAHRFNIFPTLVYIVDCSDLIEPVNDLLKTVTWNDDWNGQSENVYILNSEPKLVEEFENTVNFSLSELQYELPLKLTTVGLLKQHLIWVLVDIIIQTHFGVQFIISMMTVVN